MKPLPRPKTGAYWELKHDSTKLNRKAIIPQHRNWSRGNKRFRCWNTRSCIFSAFNSRHRRLVCSGSGFDLAEKFSIKTLAIRRECFALRRFRTGALEHLWWFERLTHWRFLRSFRQLCRCSFLLRFYLFF